MAVKYITPKKEILESVHLKDYLHQLLTQYQRHLIPLDQLRKELDCQLKGHSLSSLIRKMREESAH